MLKETCELDYKKDKGPSTSTVLCTILIIFFTIILELAVHSYMNCCNTIEDTDVYNAFGKPPDEEELLSPVITEQPQPEALLQADVPCNDTVEPNASDPTPEPEQKKRPPSPDCCTLCFPNPSPNIRANRLIAAVLLYAVVLAAFIVRMNGINNPYIRDECRRFIVKHDIPGPSWWAVALLNILPLCIASLSVLRTIVDCFLVRWGTGLKYVGQGGADDWTTWPMCMSCFLVFVCIREAARLPITLLMGLPRGSAVSRHGQRSHNQEDIEMGGEELRGLAEGVDDDSDFEGDPGGPPAYNDAVHRQEGVQTGSGKGK